MQIVDAPPAKENKVSPQDYGTAKSDMPVVVNSGLTNPDASEKE
jgi:hypothetical protein